MHEMMLNTDLWLTPSFASFPTHSVLTCSFYHSFIQIYSHFTPETHHQGGNSPHGETPHQRKQRPELRLPPVQNVHQEKTNSAEV